MEETAVEGVECYVFRSELSRTDISFNRCPSLQRDVPSHPVSARRHAGSNLIEGSTHFKMLSSLMEVGCLFFPFANPKMACLLSPKSLYISEFLDFLFGRMKPRITGFFVNLSVTQAKNLSSGPDMPGKKLWHSSVKTGAMIKILIKFFGTVP